MSENNISQYEIININKKKSKIFIYRMLMHWKRARTNIKRAKLTVRIMKKMASRTKHSQDALKVTEVGECS